MLMVSPMAFLSCGTDNEDSSESVMLFQRWVLDGYGSDGDVKEVEQNADEYDYYITLTADNTMKGKSRCNIIYGTFSCDGLSFKFTSFGGTKMGCFVEPAMSFYDNLPNVSRYVIDKDARLRLYYSDNEFFRFRTDSKVNK